MNKIKKYSFIALSLAFVLGFSACTEECDYTPALPSEANTSGVTFTDMNSMDVELSPDATKEISISVQRAEAGTATNIPILTLRNDEGIFDIPSSVNFEAGVQTAEIKITFPNAVEGELYKFEIALDNDGLYSQESISNKSGSVQCIMWEELGIGKLSVTLLGGTATCNISKARHTTWYKAVAPVEEGMDIVFKVNENNAVTVEAQPIFTDSNYGPVFVKSTDGIYNEENNTIQVILTYYCSAGTFGTFQETFTLPAK